MMYPRPKFSTNQYNDPTLPGYNPKKPPEAVVQGYWKGSSAVYDI